MAPGAVAMSFASTTNGSIFSPAELAEMAEYDKIIKFKDRVLAGAHPRIKIPAHLVGKSVNLMRNTSSPKPPLPLPHTNGTHSAQSTPGIQQNTNSNSSSSQNNRSPSNFRATTTGFASKSEINPILLEKSEDLIKAEMQLQRQRLERSLEDQIKANKVALKVAAQNADSLPTFDLTEVLSKALAIVHPATTTDVEPSVDENASDSFDENTFYSSEHPSPESSPEQSRNNGRALSQGKSRAQKRLAAHSSQDQAAIKDTGITGSIADVLLSNGYGGQLTTQANSPASQLPPKPQTQGTGIASRIADVLLSSGYGGQLTAQANPPAQQLPPNPQTQSKGKLPALGTFQSVSTHNQSLPRPVVIYSHALVNHINIQAAALQSDFANVDVSPLVRSHDLSPLAPQPARVSPLATAREPPLLRGSYAADGVTPPQVSSLRQEVSGPSSSNSSSNAMGDSQKKRSKRGAESDRELSSSRQEVAGISGSGLSSSNSSPQAPSRSEKRKKIQEKGKRRNKDGKKQKSLPNVDADDSDVPYIKPEPRSPSPFTLAPDARPQKRQRQQYGAESAYDSRSARYGSPVEYMEDPLRVSYRAPVRLSSVQYAERYEVEPRRPEPIYRRVERDDGEYRRVSSVQYERRPVSPSMQTLPYAPEPRYVRAVSRAVADRRVYEEPVVYYRDPTMRASVRPDADRERSRSPVIHERRSPAPMGPPAPRRPVRIVVDEFGREYIDPASITPASQSMAPPPKYRVPEPIYERAPLRTVSGRSRDDTFEEDGVMYRRPSPVIVAPPRRVVAHPEYAVPEYRSYRQRGYSLVPASPGDENMQVRDAPERRRQASHFEESPRQYIRAPSVRPEPVRYEVPREYRAGSVRPEVAMEPVRYVDREYLPRQSLRPEGPAVEYRMSVRPEGLPVEYRAASVRPELPREYIPRPEGPPVEYRAASVRPEAPREYITRPEGPPVEYRAASVRPEVQREYVTRPAEREIRYAVDETRYVERGRPGEIMYSERPRAREGSVMVYQDDVRREYR